MSSKLPSWYEKANSIVIWLSVIGLFGFVVYTSYDYSRQPPTLSQFGQNQLFILGFITVLLLFRYISKIKIGSIIDIEFIQTVEAAVTKANRDLEAVIQTRGLVNVPEIESAKAELNKAKGAIAIIKAAVKE